MKKGLKSLLFGVHQFAWHPITVLLAWVELYGIPNFWELLCIILHDVGYYNCSQMENEEGENHVFWAGIKMFQWSNQYKYWLLCVAHSRHITKQYNLKPSKLCWADKLSIKYDPYWFYILRAKMSGELYEYMSYAKDAGLEFNSKKEWYHYIKKLMMDLAYSQNPDKREYKNQKIGGRNE